MSHILKKSAKIASIVVFLTFTSFANSEITMKPDHRKALIHGVTQNVTADWLANDPVGSGCWKDARNGNDVSLLAVYIIAKSTPIMIKYRAAMAEAAKSSKDNDGRYQILRDAYDKLDPKKAGWYLQRVPAAVLHCTEVSGGIDLSQEKEILNKEVKKRLDL